MAEILLEMFPSKNEKQIKKALKQSGQSVEGATELLLNVSGKK